MKSGAPVQAPVRRTSMAANWEREAGEGKGGRLAALSLLQGPYVP